MGAAIYARISLDRLDGEGVERQLADCRELAAEHWHTDCVEYVDNSVSAFRNKRRPAWDRLIADLRAGVVTHLFAWHPDRLYRRIADLEELIDAAQSAELHTVKAGEVDLSNASGRMVARILGSVTRHESERMGERVRRVKLQRASEGKPAGGGKRPTGLTPTRDALVPDEAEMLREVAQRILAGGSWVGEALRLSDEGWKTTTGQAWTAGTLRRTLTNPYVTGLRTYKGQVVGEASWPPILDRDTWAALRTRTGRAQRSRHGGHLLTGHLVCDACGRRMYANQTRTGWTYRCPAQQDSNGRGCGRSIMRDRTDRIVVDTVGEWIARPAMMAAARRHLAPVDTSATRGELERVERALVDLARRLAAGDLLDFEHAAARKDLVARRAELIAQPSTPVVDLDLSAGSWAVLVEAWDVPLLRPAVQALTRPIRIGPRGADRVMVEPAWN